MNPAEAKPMYCPNCNEEIVEHDLTAKGCVFCTSTCDWCGEHDLNEDTHFIKAHVRGEGRYKAYRPVYKPKTLCEECYTLLLDEGFIKDSILDQFETLKP